MKLIVERVDPVRLEGPERLTGHDLMSPFVWRGPEGGLVVLVRSVRQPDNDDTPSGTIWYGVDDGDGLVFRMDDEPLIAPGPSPLDICGCEDPTVVPHSEEGCIVYYTGIKKGGAAQLLYAAGPDVRSLDKRGVAHASNQTERNTKEATVERTGDGEWRLLFEYAHGGRSRIGLAVGPGPHGPWEEKGEPIRARPDHWDSWHLSTGPLMLDDADAPLLFYNGSDEDARWGIGWAVMDRGCTAVLERCENPLIGPPDITVDQRDIAFAASAIRQDDCIWLYFSRNDRVLARATIRLA